ncbi:MAG: lactate utilization protein C [Betaproteobacteria bacterium]|nr:lactate utilization protein C [Betaproteobacteria bacterium]
MSARENILARIRARQGKGTEPSIAEREAVQSHLRTHPVSPRPCADWELIARFREQALKLASTVDQVATLAAVPAAVARYLERERLTRQAVCWPELAKLDWRAAGVEVAARAARGDDLVGITGAFCAIAETGTLMTVSGPDTPAAVSLLPETHITVVSSSRIVRGMEEAWQLARAELGRPPRAVTFISGPSRTADIEQTVTLGAHGPYRVHIVIAG